MSCVPLGIRSFCLSLPGFWSEVPSTLLLYVSAVRVCSDSSISVVSCGLTHPPQNLGAENSHRLVVLVMSWVGCEGTACLCSTETGTAAGVTQMAGGGRGSGACCPRSWRGRVTARRARVSTQGPAPKPALTALQSPWERGSLHHPVPVLCI